jgi:OOP family OmpA-OmpF porin
MKKNVLKMIGLLLFALVNVNESNAQDANFGSSTTPPLFTGTKEFRTWSFGLQAGSMMPFSVFGGKTSFSKGLQKLEYGAYLKYQASHAFGIQLDAFRGTLEGNNEKEYVGVRPVSPYASFKTELNWAASLSGVYTIGNINWSYMRTSLQPYLSLGVGFVSVKPTTTNYVGLIENRLPEADVTDMYIPFGFGVKANLSKSVNLDLGYTTAFVDASNVEGYMKPPYFGSKFSYAHAGLEFALGNKSKPQLSRHNPPAQLYKKMTDNDYIIRALLAASEVNAQKNSNEINRLKDEHAKMKVDTDFDGVSDLFDKCPGTLNGVKVDGSGCALPVSTKDTITKVYNNTTYIITEEDKKIAKDAVSNLEFEFGKSIIREKSLPYLNKVANLLVKKNISLKLGGHTDNVGSENANMNLSKDRAESVKNYLLSKGANSSLIEAVGYGENQPIATNKTAVGRQINRRVEFTLY